MTRADVQVSLAKAGVILGVLVALVVLTTAFKSWMSENFVGRVEYQADMAQVRNKLDRLLDVACDGRKQTLRACQ